jgi:hypothetical protein
MLARRSGPYRGGGGGGGDVLVGLYWHYDAQNMGAFANLDPVPTWIDQSGNLRHATSDTPTAAWQRHYYASAINGFPAVRFEYSGANARGYSIPGAFGPSEAHLFIVSKVDATSPPYALGPSGSGQNPSFPATVDGSATIVDHFGSTVQRAVGTAGVDTTDGFIYHAHSIAGLWESHVGNTAKASFGTNTVTWGGQKLGSWLLFGSIVNPFVGYIGEFRVYSGSLTPTQVTNITNALGTKWGITP